MVSTHLRKSLSHGGGWKVPAWKGVKTTDQQSLRHWDGLCSQNDRSSSGHTKSEIEKGDLSSEADRFLSVAPINGLINTWVWHGLTVFFHGPRNKWSYYFPTYDWFCLGPNSVGSLFCSRLILCKRWYFFLNLFQKHKSEMNRKLMHTIPNHLVKKWYLFSQFFHSASFLNVLFFFLQNMSEGFVLTRSYKSWNDSICSHQ